MFNSKALRSFLEDESSDGDDHIPSTMEEIRSNLVDRVSVDGLMSDMRRQLWDMQEETSEEDNDEETHGGLLTKRHRRPYMPRASKRSSWPQKRQADGRLVPLEPYETVWWQFYIENPPLNSQRFCHKFRRRFRMEYKSFTTLLDMVRSDIFFVKWTKKDATGRDSSPIELLLLGALRYLGRGHTFDDMEENTAISEETHRKFLHQFIEYGSTILFGKYVSTPATSVEAEVLGKDFSDAGLPGCIGSMDATHVCMIKCPAKLRNLHLSFKQNLPARTYNMVTDHRRGIMSSTTGHPSRYNDKTLVLFDNLLTSVHAGEVLDDLQFTLLARNGDEIQEVKYSGAWFITDNGYLNWPITIPPFKDPKTYAQRRWSRWIESMRKDVECTFGILKGRFVILQNGIRLHGLCNTDKVWLTCCALHNMLLHDDGLNENWQSSSDSDYVSQLGNVALLSKGLAGMGFGNDVDSMLPIYGLEEEEGPTEVVPSSSGIIPVRSLSLNSFRDRLVEHFDILWPQNKIKWPERVRMNGPQMS